MISNILIISLSIMSLLFAIAYFLITKKLNRMIKEYAKLSIDHISLQKFIESLNLDDITGQEVHKENFIKFLSDSRDWAFAYIEDVQSELKKFIEEIEPEINYFNEYGDLTSMQPNYYSLKKISEAYYELTKLLPKEEDEVVWLDNMEFYSFDVSPEESMGYQDLYDHHFSGALFAYSPVREDFFTKIARYANKEHNLKYIVAIRPYTISGQYLCTINNTLNKIIPNQLQINFVNGWPYKEEKEFGGILGDINDSSSNIDRSHYLIEYIDNLNQINGNKPDYYLSVTNHFIYDLANKHNDKMIIPYSYFSRNMFNLLNKDVMISIRPILRQESEQITDIHIAKTEQDIEVFSHKEFCNLIALLKENNINKIENEFKGFKENFIKKLV